MLYHTLCCVSNNKFCNCFYSFCLLETFLLSNRGKSQGTLLLALAPGSLVARSLGFHLGVLGLIPGQEAKISLQYCLENSIMVFHPPHKCFSSTCHIPSPPHGKLWVYLSLLLLCPPAGTRCLRNNDLACSQRQPLLCPLCLLALLLPRLFCSYLRSRTLGHVASAHALVTHHRPQPSGWRVAGE